MLHAGFVRVIAPALAVVLLLFSTSAHAGKKTRKADSAKANIMKSILPSIEKLEEQFSLKAGELAIIVHPGRQQLYLVKDRTIQKTYNVSTARLGLGTKQNSFKTPWGTHRIKTKIGDGAKRGTIFKHQEDTGRIAKIRTSKARSRASITTRIMWLDGQEAGVNNGPGIGSYERYIYVHGTSWEGGIGTPVSAGCVVMKNDDVIDLFDRVPEGTLVEIIKKGYGTF